MPSQAADLLPMWTKRVVANTGGRDPLGLSRVAFPITDFQLSGIITTTDRARYYSFYFMHADDSTFTFDGSVEAITSHHK